MVSCDLDFGKVGGVVGGGYDTLILIWSYVRGAGDLGMVGLGMGSGGL